MSEYVELTDPAAIELIQRYAELLSGLEGRSVLVDEALTQFVETVAPVELARLKQESRNRHSEEFLEGEH